MNRRALFFFFAACASCGGAKVSAPSVTTPTVVDLPAAADLPDAPGARVTVVDHSPDEAAPIEQPPTLRLDRANVSAPYRLRDIELGVIAQTGWDAATDASGIVFVKREREVSFRDASLGADPRVIVWTRRAPMRVERVVLAGDVVYVVSADTVGEWNVHALARRDGALRWARHVLGQSLVLLPTSGHLTWARDGVLSEVSIDRGVELWSYAFAHEPSNVRFEGGDCVASGSEIGTTRLRVDPSRHETPLRIAGHVRVAGFPTHEGIAIEANGRWAAKTRADGSFELTVPVHGTLTFWCSAPRDARVLALAQSAMMAPGVHDYVVANYWNALDADQAAHDGLEVTLEGGGITKD